MIDILRFWRDVEAFNIPDAPATGDLVQRFLADLHPQASPPLLPWNHQEFAPKDRHTFVHAVFLGVGRKDRFTDTVLRVSGPRAERSATERELSIGGKGWLAAFLVDAEGFPLPKSFVCASFALGVSLLSRQAPLDALTPELESMTREFDLRVAQRDALRSHRQGLPSIASFPIIWDDLLDEWKRVHLLVGETPQPGGPAMGPDIIVQSTRLSIKDDGTLKPSPESAVSFLNSFFLNDLSTLIQLAPRGFGAALRTYLGEPSPVGERLDLLRHPRLLAGCITPDVLPLGRWPSRPSDHLALAQQAAVYQIVRSLGPAKASGLMSVNGPPGTGKTTLLKDVIAEVVVQRAGRLADLESPEDLFLSGVTLGGQPFHPLNPMVVGASGIVVTSSNNAAVQNLSLELPFACDRGAFPDASYFSGVATNIAAAFKRSRAEPWGLVAGALGSSKNRSLFAKALMGYEKSDAPLAPQHSFKPLLERSRREGPQRRREWFEAKARFLQLQTAVEVERHRLMDLQTTMDELPAIPGQQQSRRTMNEARARQTQALLVDWTSRHSALNAQMAAVTQALHTLGVEHQNGITQIATLQEALKDARVFEEPGVLARWLKKLLGVENQAFRRWVRAIREAKTQLEQAQTHLRALDQKRVAQETQGHALNLADRQGLALFQQQHERLDAQSSAALREIAQLEARRQHLLHLLDQARKTKTMLPDEAFLALPLDDQHRQSLWVSDPLDRLRSELFLAALRLHETTVHACAERWRLNLFRIRDFLSGDLLALSNPQTAQLWDALFFVVPVVSTTLASFDRLFKGMGSESLGWLLIDEAGQATPQAVAGALWRSRRAVIVGDPLQIEPVVTVPHVLVQRLTEQRALDPDRWSPVFQSAQTLADRTMHLGARVGDTWTGLPLRTHRRCMSPMFEIANRIAYDDQMVQATGDSPVAPDPSPSCWIDVAGSSGGGKVVQEEIDTLKAVLTRFEKAWPNVVNGKGDALPATVYVISPFRDVAFACKAVVDSFGFAQRKLEVDAGTVHTFQGKEASIVFLVLGSAPGDAGAGSRRWAASKPNLLNVAVTRAQQRLYVIGSRRDWENQSFFDEMATRLVGPSSGSVLDLEPYTPEALATGT